MRRIGELAGRSQARPDAVRTGRARVSWHLARCLPLGYRGGDGRRGPADLDVLDGLLGDLADAADQVLLEPLRALTGEGRDQDVVDPVVLDRVLDRVEGIGAHRLAGGVDVGAVELGQGRGEITNDLRLAD